jgi:hypothetical protein
MKGKLYIVTAGTLLVTACSVSTPNKPAEPCSASCAKDAVVKLLQQDQALAVQLGDQKNLGKKAADTLKKVQAKPNLASRLYAAYIWDITSGIEGLTLGIVMSDPKKLSQSDACLQLKEAFLEYSGKYKKLDRGKVSTQKLNDLAKQFSNERQGQQCFKVVK